MYYLLLYQLFSSVRAILTLVHHIIRNPPQTDAFWHHFHADNNNCALALLGKRVLDSYPAFFSFKTK